MKKIFAIVCVLLFSMSVPVSAMQVEPITVHEASFAIERTNITTASVNIAFGFASGRVSRKVLIETPSTNTADICLVWFGGGTAVCPAANTAGTQRFAPGTSLLIDNITTPSVSVIAASGTQTIKVSAWR